MKKNPSTQEINTLVALFSVGKYSEAASLAKSMTVRFPLHGFGWTMLGVTLGQMGRNAEALAPLKKAAALSPGDAGAHINLGKNLQDLGRLDEAEVSYRRALQIKPDFAEAHSNLGNILQETNRLDKAESSFRRALQIKPDFAEAHSNLGNTLRDLGRLDEAEESYRRALQIKPHHAETHNNLGATLLGMNRLAEAEASYRRAITLNPVYADAYGNLGATLLKQGNYGDALECFQQQIKLEPENEATLHHIASLTGNNPERAPIQYVENLFDEYADKFDSHLQEKLKYEIPEKLVALVTQHGTSPAEKWNVLDLGCGTGLAGVAIAPFARQLIGVDLSAKMLEKAHARIVYQRLERSDLLTMMRAEKASSFDVIMAADVFVYLGKLDEIVSETKRLLSPGGYFAFSVEELDVISNIAANQGGQLEYRLNNTGRYSHSAGYLTRLAATNGFLALDTVATQIRQERGQPVNGHMVLWKS